MTKWENPLKITLLNAWMGKKPVMPASREPAAGASRWGCMGKLASERSA